MRARGLKFAQASEHEEQAALVSWAFTFRKSYPELEMLFAIPNQGAARLKNLQTEGVMRGVPDLMLAVARGPWHGLFIELKRRKGGKLSMEQIGWLSRLAAEGYCAIRCDGWDEAREGILRYLRGESE
jgi:hypothetical protein